MTADDIEIFMRNRVGRSMGVIDRIIDHADYALPAREWLANDFSTALRHNFQLLGIDQYIGNEVMGKNICVDFALHAMSQARICAVVTPDQPWPVLFGRVGYLKQVPGSLPGGHRINFSIVFEGGIHNLVWYEPQAYKIVTLLPEEVDSIHSIDV